MPGIPHDPALDNSLALLREGYAFISRRCDRLGADAFSTRLMLQPVVCMRGADAARFFYEGDDRFSRRGALPQPAVRLVQDKGSAQMLDGATHAHRKRLFMDLMTPTSIERFAELFERHWREAIPRWERQGEVVLLHGASEVITRAVCDWAGVPLADRDAPRLARELVAMVGHAGSVGPGTWWHVLRRRGVERWMRGVVRRVRAGALTPPDGSAAASIPRWTERGGAPLRVGVAGVELLNIVRPTVAAGRYVAFAAHALHEHPEWRERLAASDDDLEPFVQEVRRYYPLIPMMGGRALRPLEWGGHRFAEGDWVLLDIYGTNRDPKLWDEPDRFRPERFRGWPGDPYTLIPNGAGDYAGHRCPGEWITIALVKRAVRLLVHAMRYDVPPQDLSIPLADMPTAPASGFVIGRVRGLETPGAAA